ncbi:MAG: restriction endonuclease subunit S [Deltaproteobacteria bacterium]|jgi:type I restriction enzyme S subunit|nr:restriction endonuclease subunit S [Deltaproteobacteria bacterium]
MTSWPTVKLQEVVSVRYGSGLTWAKRTGGTYPVYGSSGIVGYHNKPRYRGPAIVIGRKGNVGTVYYCETSFWPIDTVYYINQVDYKRCRLKYIYHVLKTLHLTQRDEGTAVPGLLITTINESRILLPSLEEQDEIIRVLNCLDEKTLLLEKQNQTLLSMAHLFFRVLFEDCPLDHQRMVPLIHFGYSVSGHTPPKRKKENFGEPFPFVKIPDIHGRIFVVDAKTKLTHQGSKACPGGLIPPGVVFVSCVGTIGLVALGVTPCHTNQQVHSIIPKDPRHLLYLFCLFRNLEGELENMASGGTVAPNITLVDFNLMPVPLPGRLPLEIFNQMAEPLFARILCNERELVSVREIKAAVAPNLVMQSIHLGQRPIAGPSQDRPPKEPPGQPVKRMAKPLSDLPSPLEMLINLRRAMNLPELPRSLRSLPELALASPPGPKSASEPTIEDMVDYLKELMPQGAISPTDPLPPYDDLIGKVREAQAYDASRPLPDSAFGLSVDSFEEGGPPVKKPKPFMRKRTILTPPVEVILSHIDSSPAFFEERRPRPALPEPIPRPPRPARPWPPRAQAESEPPPPPVIAPEPLPAYLDNYLEPMVWVAPPRPVVLPPWSKEKKPLGRPPKNKLTGPFPEISSPKGPASKKPPSAPLIPPRAPYPPPLDEVLAAIKRKEEAEKNKSS